MVYHPPCVEMLANMGFWPARQAAKICQHRGPLPVPLQSEADQMEVPELQKPMPAISSHPKLEGKPMINHNCEWVL